MTSLTDLLKLAMTLLLVVQNNPSLPDSQKQQAIQVATQAIQMANSQKSNFAERGDLTSPKTNMPQNPSWPQSPTPGGGISGTKSGSSNIPAQCNFFVAPTCGEGEKLVFKPGTCDYVCSPKPREPKMCTTEMKLCPDGKTYVGRDPEKSCQFKACPSAMEFSTKVPEACLFYPSFPTCPDGQQPIFKSGTCDYTCPSKPEQPKMCTTEMKLCPDGKTYVGRDPEKSCQFRACPITTTCPTPSFVCPNGDRPVAKVPGSSEVCDYVCASMPGSVSGQEPRSPILHSSFTSLAADVNADGKLDCEDVSAAYSKYQSGSATPADVRRVAGLIASAGISCPALNLPDNSSSGVEYLPLIAR